MEIWIDLGVLRFFTTNTGGLRDYRLEVQNWGLKVKEATAVLELVGRSSITAQLGLKLEDAPRPDIALARAQGTLIALQAITGDLPKILVGTSTGAVLPYFWPLISADTTLASEEWVDARVFLGGKPY